METEVTVYRFLEDGTAEVASVDRGILAREMQVEQFDARASGRRPGQKVLGSNGREFGLSYDLKAVRIAELISHNPVRG